MTVRYDKKIDSKAGTYIVANSRGFEDMLIKEPLLVDSLEVNVGEETTLYDWFNSPVMFCGFLNENEAIFYLGEGDSTLFEAGGSYYDLTFIIALDRIGKSYKQGTFRDSFLREKNNKKYWK